MRYCITPHVEPSTTTGEMDPSFGEPTLRISTDIQVFRPFTIAKRIGIRVSYASLSSVMKLGFVAQATVWTRNVKHKISFSERPPPHRVRQSGALL